MKKLPHTNKYEIRGEKGSNRKGAFEGVLRDITAANALGIPFTVKTVATKEFRNGGNVNKADVLTYIVVLGEETTKGGGVNEGALGFRRR